jgi:hypothetical protein
VLVLVVVLVVVSAGDAVADGAGGAGAARPSKCNFCSRLPLVVARHLDCTSSGNDRSWCQQRSSEKEEGNHEMLGCGSF